MQFEDEYLATVMQRLRATLSFIWNRLISAQRMSNAPHFGAKFSTGCMRCLSTRVAPATGKGCTGSEVRLLLLLNSSLYLNI
jgi:hypothetical protein